jgi:hypothetical protein
MRLGKQELFRSMILGVLLYSVVLGFFNDYTDILDTGSYSTTFAVAVVLQLLTFVTFEFKRRVVATFRSKDKTSKVALALSVWLIMFVSKFVFLAVIDVIFGNNVSVSGFVGLLLIIACLTLTQSLVERIDKSLAT